MMKITLAFIAKRKRERKRWKEKSKNGSHLAQRIGLPICRRGPQFLMLFVSRPAEEMEGLRMSTEAALRQQQVRSLPSSAPTAYQSTRKVWGQGVGRLRRERLFASQGKKILSHIPPANLLLKTERPTPMSRKSPTLLFRALTGGTW